MIDSPGLTLAGTGGTKHKVGKPPLDLLSSHALLEMAKVMGWGITEKIPTYAPHNWRKGVPWSDLYAATLRHLLSWNSREDNAIDSNLPHLAHALCNLMMLMEYAETHPELDDRYKKGNHQ